MRPSYDYSRDREMHCFYLRVQVQMSNQHVWYAIILKATMISRCGNGIIVLSGSLPVFTRVGGYLALCTATVTVTLPMSIQGSDVS